MQAKDGPCRSHVTDTSIDKKRAANGSGGSETNNTFEVERVEWG